MPAGRGYASSLEGNVRPGLIQTIALFGLNGESHRFHWHHIWVRACQIYYWKKMWCFYGMPPRPNPHNPWWDSVGLRYLAGVGDGTKSPVTGLTKATPNIHQLPPSVAVRWMKPLFQTWRPDFCGEMLMVEMCHYNRASLSTMRFSSWLGDCFFLKFLVIILYNIQHGKIQILNLALKVLNLASV